MPPDDTATRDRAALDRAELDRFVTAQADSYAAALAEIRSGKKRSHWMWFVFPQIAGLGASATARHYAIRSREEARAYLDHPLLGPRYRACCVALQHLPATSAEAVFGGVDAMKLRSSLTLFCAVDDDPLFAQALHRWFAGDRDAATLRLLAETPRGLDRTDDRR